MCTCQHHCTDPPTVIPGRFARANLDRRRDAWILRCIAPEPSDIIAFGGGYLGRRERKGGSGGAAPIKRLMRMLACHRRVVVVNEYYTSQRCSWCESALIDAGGMRKLCKYKECPRLKEEEDMVERRIQKAVNSRADQARAWAKRKRKQKQGMSCLPLALFAYSI